MQQSKYYFAHIFDDFEPLLSQKAMDSMTVRPGEYLVAPGEGIAHAFYLRSGLCKASALTEEGYELTLTFYGPGALYPVKCRQFHFCLEPALLFQAILPTSVWVLEPAAIEALIRTCPDFAVRAVDFHTMQGNLYLTRHMVSLQKDLCAKVAAFLYLYHSNSGGQSDLIPLSQNEVAAVLGISRVQVARAYRVLRGRQLLAPQRGGVRILDAEGLRACCPSFIVI